MGGRKELTTISIHPSTMASSNSARNRLAGIAAAIGVMIWLLAPFAGLLWIGLSNSNQSFVDEQEAWVPIESSTEVAAVGVDIALLWNEPEVIIAPAWSGVLQSISFRPGVTISSGDEVAVVDGVSRLAWHSQYALYRSLSIDSRGPDVQAVKELLEFRGLPQSEGDRFDAVALRATRTLARDLNVPDGAHVQSFDPMWIVYLPGPTFDVAFADLQVAAPVPPAGSELARSQRNLASAAIVESGTATTSIVDSSGKTAELNSTDFDLIVAKSGVLAGEAEHLVYASTSLDLDDSRGNLTPESLGVIADSVRSGTPGLPARLVSEPVDGQVRIPTASVTTNNGDLVICIERNDKVTKGIVQIVANIQQGIIVIGDFKEGDAVRVPGPSGNRPCQSTSGK